jgi:hypothetical protein
MPEKETGNKKMYTKIKRIFHENQYSITILAILIFLVLILQFIPSIGFQNVIIIYEVILILGSSSLTIIIVRGIQKKYTWDTLMKRFKLKKKPKIFEFAFLLGIFFSTFILAIAYGESNRTTIEGITNFFQFYGLSLIFYGISIACGYFHYIERIDE